MNVTPEQQEKLEAVFEQAPKPSHAAHRLLATKMGVSPQKTKVWFRDARQRKRVLGQGGSLGTLQQSENSLLQIEVPHSVLLSWALTAQGTESSRGNHTMFLSHSQVYPSAPQPRVISACDVPPVAAAVNMTQKRKKHREFRPPSSRS